MTADQRLLVIGLYINSALYLVGCAAFGYLTNHPWSWRAALASMALCYISYLTQLMPAPRAARIAAFALSIAAGTFAGLSLLW